MNKVGVLCKQAVVAAVYVALCAVNPFSFGALQFRVANILLALPLIDRKYAPAILLGVAIANTTSPIGIYDVAFGVCAEGIAYAFTVYGPGKGLPSILRIIVVSICVACVVGAELTWLVRAPFVATAGGLFVTTAMAVSIGYGLFARSRLRSII